MELDPDLVSVVQRSRANRIYICKYIGRDIEREIAWLLIDDQELARVTVEAQRLQNP